jgi:hypothetical protein
MALREGYTMIDLQREKLIGLRAAAESLPPGWLHRPISESCVLRWIRKGVLLSSGERVRLEAVRIGGHWRTTIPALQRFTQRNGS